MFTNARFGRMLPFKYFTGHFGTPTQTSHSRRAWDMEDLESIFLTFYVDTKLRDMECERLKSITPQALNQLIIQEKGHALSRWLLMLDLEECHLLSISHDTLERLRKQVIRVVGTSRQQGDYISPVFGSLISHVQQE